MDASCMSVCTHQSFLFDHGYLVMLYLLVGVTFIVTNV